MATGSGTGTPASAAGSATLATLRARVLQQVTAAGSGIDPMVVTASTLTLTTLRDRVETILKSGESDLIEREVVTASTETLTTLRDRVETTLQDSGNAIWASGDVDEALEQVLERYNRVNPDRAIGTIALAASGREVSLATLTGLIRVEKVWCPYVSASPDYPPNWVDFRVWPGGILYVDSPDEPQNTEVVRVWYTKAHTINGLDGASATTIPVDDITFLISGAAALCALYRSIEQAEQANVDDKVYGRLVDWSGKMTADFEEGLRIRERRRRQDYDQDELDEAIRQALEQYSRYKPDRAISTITLAADGREVDISSLTTAVRIEKVWWDYDSTSPGHPPQWRHFEVWPGDILYINDPTEPSGGEKVRIQYTKNHTLNGLDGASATTLPTDDEAFVVAGAAAFAVRFRVARSGDRGLGDWADKMMREFNEGVRMRDWRQYMFQFDQDDIDEALRWALDRYSEINPEETITSVTLSSDGREVDISSITDYLDVTRVWWDYDSSDPEYPPKWRNFEVWPGDILFVDASGEPQSGDVVRVWYTRPRTLNGLDAASTTTLSADHETLVVIGASGFVAQERVQDENRRYVPRKLREWAAARLREFERGLKALGRRQAARHSGVAPMAALDRWDRGDGAW